MKNGEVQEPTGLAVDVIREDGIDCTNGGISSKRDKLFDDESVDRDGRFIQIVAWYGYYKAVPRYHERRSRENGPAFGGNYIYSDDPRWTAKYPEPIKLHDHYWIS